MSVSGGQLFPRNNRMSVSMKRSVSLSTEGVKGGKENFRGSFTLDGWKSVGCRGMTGVKLIV